jgi:probable F420-dependent oxidoreductase
VQFGLRTPVVSWAAIRNDPWEQEAGLAEVTEVAKTADRLGYSVMTCPEHVAVPPGLASWSGGMRGTVFWDPLVTFGYLAAHTERIRLATMTIVIGYYHPLEIAKRYGTVDFISGGRLIMGIGVGSAKEEFELLDAPFDDRGARADDALRALRVAFADPVPTYHGPYYDFEGFVIEPHAVQARVPLWIGGHTMRSLRRAVELGDAWAPQSGLTPEQLTAMLGQVDPPEGFELVCNLEPPLDPLEDGDRALEEVEARRAIGASTAIVAFHARSLAHYLEQMAAFAALVGEDGAFIA